MAKKKLVVFGTGLRSTFFIDEIVKNEDCELAALCDQYPTRLATAARHIGRPDIPLFTDINECLDKVECDAVVNCTSDSAHAKTTVPVLERGKFVFLEKPLAITKEDCRAIVDADRKAGGKTYVGLNLRHAPLYKKAKEIIDSGILGRVLTIQADEFYEGGKTYFRRWNRLRSLSGGLWITKACHDFDLIQWLAGGNPEAVAAFSHLSVYTPNPEYGMYCGECPVRPECPDAFDDSNVTARWLELTRAAVADGMQRPDLCLYNSDKDTIDHGTVIVDFDNDVTANYTLNVVAGFSNRRIRISGTKATIDGDLQSQQILIQHIHPKHTETIELSTGTEAHGGADRHLLPDFLSFIEGKSKPAVTPQEAMVSVMMGLAATESSDTGHTVQLFPVP